MNNQQMVHPLFNTGLPITDKALNAYINEIKRVLEVNNVDEEVIYDAFHNASLMMQRVTKEELWIYDATI